MTARQHKFCVSYVACRNPKEASIEAGYSVAYSTTKAYSLLKVPKIREKIATLSKEYYQAEFQQLALKSIKTLDSVLDNELAPSSQLQAIKYILTQAGVTDSEDQTGVIEIKVRLPDGL